MSRIHLINGPNLNRLGQREPEVYGRLSLADIEAQLTQAATELGHELHCLQSNSEGALVDAVHAAADAGADFLLLNPAAYTHTSIALRDALLAVDLRFIEIHLSNVYRREAFRQRSYFSDIAVGVICGLGAQGYQLALAAAHAQLQPPA
jgi:3-dehydroquinate dehydratase-2